MNFIQKMIVKRAKEKDQDIKQANWDFLYHVKEIKRDIDDLKDLIAMWKTDRKSINEGTIERFELTLNMLDRHYSIFLLGVASNKRNYEFALSKSTKLAAEEALNYLLAMKKKYRAEFENIYTRFKSIKGVEIPNRNQILSKMRKVFDFDNSIYRDKQQYKPQISGIKLF